MSLAQHKTLEFMEEIFRAASNSENKDERQRLAVSRLEQIKFPSKKDEDWKYYDFDDLLSGTTKHKPIATNELEHAKKLIAEHVFPETVNQLLVTLNGAFSPELSTLQSLEGLVILDFKDADKLKNSNIQIQEIVKKTFAKGIETEGNLFKVINTSLMKNGFLLYVEDNTTIKQALQILHISNQNSFNQIRSLIYLGKNSELKISVSDIGIAGANYITNTVVEATLEKGSRLKLDKIQDESTSASRLYNLSVNQEQDSRFEYNSFSFGAKSSREDLEVNLNDKGAEAIVSGLFVVNEKRKSHHKVVVNHNAAHTKSEQLFKGLLDDSSRAEFNGLIDIKSKCPQANASQLNSNLLLSPNARIDSRPQLNIVTDDVKANHGSSTGQLDEDELFYLQSRGFSHEDAKIVLTYSFCREIISKVELESAKDYVSKLAVKNLDNKLKANLDNKSVIKQCLIDATKK